MFSLVIIINFNIYINNIYNIYTNIKIAKIISTMISQQQKILINKLGKHYSQKQQKIFKKDIHQGRLANYNHNNNTYHRCKHININNDNDNNNNNISPILPQTVFPQSCTSYPCKIPHMITNNNSNNSIYPYSCIGLVIYRQQNNDIIRYCTGTLIYNNIVITHNICCTNNYNQQMDHKYQIWYVPNFVYNNHNYSNNINTNININDMSNIMKYKYIVKVKNYYYINNNNDIDIDSKSNEKYDNCIALLQLQQQIQKKYGYMGILFNLSSYLQKINKDKQNNIINNQQNNTKIKQQITNINNIQNKQQNITKEQHKQSIYQQNNIIKQPNNNKIQQIQQIQINISGYSNLTNITNISHMPQLYQLTTKYNVNKKQKFNNNENKQQNITNPQIQETNNNNNINNKYIVYNNIMTYYGQTGCPIYTYNQQNGHYYIIGIHLGNIQQKQYNQCNRCINKIGILLNNQHKIQFNNWICKRSASLQLQLQLQLQQQQQQNNNQSNNNILQIINTQQQSLLYIYGISSNNTNTNNNNNNHSNKQNNIYTLSLCSHLLINITWLELWNNKIGTQQCKYLSKCLFPNLTRLSLSQNNINGEGFKYLSQNSVWNYLSVLTLSNNCIDDSVLLKWMQKTNWPSLSILTLSYNKVTNIGILGLTKINKNIYVCNNENNINQANYNNVKGNISKSLTWLQLYGNRISKMGESLNCLKQMFPKIFIYI